MFVTPCEAAWEPADVALRLSCQPGLAWLDGGLEHGSEGRFSFVATGPSEVREQPAGEPLSKAFLEGLSASAESPMWSAGRLTPGDVPRWIGHIAYDACWSARGGSRHARDSGLPIARFARYEAVYVYDHAERRAYLVGDDSEACTRLLRALELPRVACPELDFAAGAVAATSPAVHRAAIRRALEHIRAGDVYEINLARRFAASFSGSALGLYLRMRDASPVPLGYFVDAGDHAVLGRSMERYLRFRATDRAVWTSPIKGTIARRGDESAETAALMADPKEHAEHAMVVDLMRNDLSRVSEVGSVEVSELMTVLPFRGLSHLVSTVRGRVRSGLTLGDVVSATFPPGSVTGAPKESAIAIIDALEEAPRGVYPGALGFVDRAGGCSFAVGIRTAVVRGGEVEYFAGGGIVAASSPERETEETDLKAQVFLRALQRESGRAED